MFIDILNKVTQSCISHTPLRMIQSLTLKGKEQNKYRDRGEEVSSYRNLLLWMVKLIHADPMLLLNVNTLYKNPNFNSQKDPYTCIYIYVCYLFYRIREKLVMKFKVQL